MDYLINENTCALVPIKQTVTKIIENNKEYRVNCDIYTIVNNSCKFYGSSYNGRIEGSKNLLGKIYKIPIIIDERNNITFFPTTSPRLSNNMWIAFNNILELKKKDKNTLILFKTGKKFIIRIPYNQIYNQMVKASLLNSVLNVRTSLKKEE